MIRRRERRPDQPAQRAFVAVVVIVAVLGVAGPVLTRPALEIATSRSASVRVGGARVAVTVADTPWRRACGLQGRTVLHEGEGMLFVFDRPGPQTFRRKTVPFALDCVFVSASSRVTGIARLDGAHETAASPGPALYVLEVPAGWSSRHGVSEGATVTIEW